jgi:hypothetical protein
MTESVLVEWEDSVLGEGHDAITGEAQRANRDVYDYPNGCHVAVGGLDKPDRIMSTQWDVVCVFEATEVSASAVDKLKSRLRNNKLPWQQIVMDCNPGNEFHWLNQSFPDHEGIEEGGRVRLLSRHEDNPSVTEEYLDVLRSLSPTDRARLYEGRWVTATGLVYEEFNPKVHYIAKEEVAQELHNEFKLRRIVCDPEEPERIKTFNDRLSFYRDRTVRKIAVKAENPIMTGIDMVRWGLNPKSVPDLQVGSEREGPQLFLVKGALRYGVDENLKSELRPTSLEQEIVSFVWDESTADDTKVSKDRPDPKCADHALDCMRYAAMYAWKKDRVRRKKEPRFKPGTFGHFFNHEQILGKRRPD